MIAGFEDAFPALRSEGFEETFRLSWPARATVSSEPPEESTAKW